MTNILTVAGSRGFLHDATPGLAARLAAGPITAYVGFDPTADSLHVGNLVPVMGLAWLQRTGGPPVADRGRHRDGRRPQRQALRAADAVAGAGSGKRSGHPGQLAQFLDFGGGQAARLLNNAEWLRGLNLLDFLRDTGKHFTVNYMLQKDSVKSRMESGISFTEFSYMLVQAYDLLAPARDAAVCDCRWAAATSGAISRRASSWRAPAKRSRAPRAGVPAAHDHGGEEVREERGGERLARPGED